MEGAVFCSITAYTPHTTLPPGCKVYDGPRQKSESLVLGSSETFYQDESIVIFFTYTQLESCVYEELRIEMRLP